MRPMLLVIVLVLASCQGTKESPESAIQSGISEDSPTKTEDTQTKDVPTNPSDPNAVLRAGDVVEFSNKNGTMRITADSDLMRTFTWDGASRSVIMERRREPWYGALGLYWPGPGNHWQDHNGVRRGVLQEQTRDFDDEAAFREWLKEYQHWYDAKYTPDGIVAGWSINLSRSQLNVELWRITIAGRSPEDLEGGSTGWLTWIRMGE